jgi:hypothetical protein
MQMEPEDKNIICIGQKAAAYQAWRSANPADQHNIATIINETAKDLGLFYKIRNQLKTGQPIDMEQLQLLIPQITDGMIRQKAKNLLDRTRQLKILDGEITSFSTSTTISDLEGAEEHLQRILYTIKTNPEGSAYLPQAIFAIIMANDSAQLKKLEELETKLKNVHKDFVVKTYKYDFEFSNVAVDMKPDWLEKFIEHFHEEAREAQKKKKGERE